MSWSRILLRISNGYICLVSQSPSSSPSPSHVFFLRLCPHQFLTIPMTALVQGSDQDPEGHPTQSHDTCLIQTTAFRLIPTPHSALSRSAAIPRIRIVVTHESWMGHLSSRAERAGIARSGREGPRGGPGGGGDQYIDHGMPPRLR